MISKYEKIFAIVVVASVVCGIVGILYFTNQLRSTFKEGKGESFCIEGKITDISYSGGFVSMTSITFDNTKVYPILGIHSDFEINKTYKVWLKESKFNGLFILVDYKLVG